MPRWAMLALAVAAAASPGCGRLGYRFGDGGTRDGGTPSGPDASRPAICGDGEVDGAEICDDGNTTPGDGCSADCAARTLCGDGAVGAGEACDDGNGIDTDGCRSDCTFSCTDDPGCDDALPCNGAETCDLGLHRCELGTAAPDGTSCGGTNVCRGGSCAPASCGDGITDAGEECDDDNFVDGDGCDNDCTFSCELAADCDDGTSCNGVEDCVGNICIAADVLPLAGAVCDRDADALTRDICIAGDCHRSVCGDAYVDVMATPPEQCDDDNLENGDGCDNDCTFSCEVPADCDDGNPCNGPERCVGNRCAAATFLPVDDTPCPGGTCQAGRCEPTGGSDGGPADGGPPMLPDSGGLCPEPATPSMPVECFRRCVAEEDCVIVSTGCCCSCASGGGWDTINRAFAAEWTARLRCDPRLCAGRFCLDVYLCPAAPQCVDGMCFASGSGVTM